MLQEIICDNGGVRLLFLKIPWEGKIRAQRWYMLCSVWLEEFVFHRVTLLTHAEGTIQLYGFLKNMEKTGLKYIR